MAIVFDVHHFKQWLPYSCRSCPAGRRRSRTPSKWRRRGRRPRRRRASMTKSGRLQHLRYSGYRAYCCVGIVVSVSADWGKSRIRAVWMMTAPCYSCLVLQKHANSRSVRTLTKTLAFCSCHLRKARWQLSGEDLRSCT